MSAEDKSEQFIMNIHNALIKDWDPIGVGSSPDVQDEYDSYISGILDILDEDENASAASIAAYLIFIEEEYIGLSPDHGRAQKVSEKIWKHFEKFIA